MSDLKNLLGRIDAEFEAAKKRVAEFQQEKTAEYEARQERLAKFNKICDQLQDVWRPRLDALVQRFGERVSVTPNVTSSLRQATFRIQSQLATIRLTFAAMTDSDVRHFILRYELEILPILMKFKHDDRLEVPLDQIDQKAIGAWMDDRIVDFVKTFLELHRNEQYLNYLKHYMVEDPIAGVRFPKYAAAAQCDWNNETYYFIGDVTCQEFRKKHGIQ